MGATYTGSKHKGLCRVHGNCANVVWVCFERGDLFGRVVVVYAHLEVIGACSGTRSTYGLGSIKGRRRTCNDPVLACDEATGADGDIGELECLDDRLRNVRPDVDVSCQRQCLAGIAISQLAIPLYKVVRIHGSVGWKSCQAVSDGLAPWRCGSYQCLAHVSMEPRVILAHSLRTLDSLRARKELALCPHAG
jgi:hypothetical protein